MELSSNHPAIVIYDAFRGHRGEEVQSLLAVNNLLSVHVPSNCTDRLQPLDVSVNKAVKNVLRKSFIEWYSNQVSTQLKSGTSVEDVKVDMSLSVMKELGAEWIVATYDYLRSNPPIVINGFKGAGILPAVEGEVLGTGAETSDDEDPFAEFTDNDE